MDPETENRIEDRLRAYPLHKARLEDVTRYIAEAAPANDTGPVSHAVSDPTGSRAARLCTDHEVMGLQQLIREIDDCLRLMSADQRTICEVRYFCRQTMQDAADAVPYSLREAYRDRREILAIVQTRLGW